MNILVTGANGQLGQEVRRASLGGEHHFIFTDINELDITEYQAVSAFVRDHKIGLIINCAAYTQVDKAEEDLERCTHLNEIAVCHLAKAARQVDATLIHISTDYVFSGQAYRPLHEDDPTAPIGVYGHSKLRGEEAIRLSGCRHIIIRTSWLYSIYGSNFVKTMIKLTGERPKLQVVFDQVGTPTYARDLAGLILHIIQTQQYSQGGTYHFSNEGVCSWYDFACEIADLVGNSSCDIAPCHSTEFPSKVARPHYSVLDKTKVKATFGYPIPHWRTSLKACIRELDEISGQHEGSMPS